MKHHPVQTLPPDIKRWVASGSGTPYVHERLGSAPGPDVLVTALVHGNEYSGAVVVNELLASHWLPANGRVTFAFCNMAAFERFDAAAPDASRYIDEDFNRVWSTARLDSSAVSSELTRARRLRPFVDRATHLLDLHSMHEPSTPLWITGTLHRNIDFAQALQTPCQVIIDSGHQDGVRMRDYGEFSNPAGKRIALLLEAGQHWQASSVSVARNAVMRFLSAAGSIARQDAPPGWLSPDSKPAPQVQVTHSVVATSMDFAFTASFNGGETITKAGTVIATDSGRPVVTPYDNCMLVMPSLRQLRVGVTTLRMGKQVVATVKCAQAAPK